MRKSKNYNWTVIAASINKWLQDYSLYNKRYSHANLVAKLTEFGLPKAKEFIPILVKSGFLKEEKFGTSKNYYFSEPVLQGKFHNIMTQELNKLRERNRKYNQTAYNKKIKMQVEQKPTTEEDAINEAIKLLKNTGDYQILKKVIEWKEILSF